MIAVDISVYVLLVVQLAVVVVGLFATVHAARQRAEAFTSVDKLTKGKWLGIVVASTLVVLVFGFRGGGFLLSLVATTAVFVYLADVRPKVDEIQRGSRW